MATGVWGQAQTILREAADIIEQRSAGRDEDGRPDTIALAALSEGLTEQQVLAAMVGIKRIRLSRGHDHDSAIDLLAYEARRLVACLPVQLNDGQCHYNPDPEVSRPIPPVIDDLPPDSDENPGLSAGTAVGP
jgi:hypothetical protein